MARSPSGVGGIGEATPTYINSHSKHPNVYSLYRDAVQKFQEVFCMIYLNGQPSSCRWSFLHDPPTQKKNPVSTSYDTQRSPNVFASNVYNGCKTTEDQCPSSPKMTPNATGSKGLRASCPASTCRAGLPLVPRTSDCPSHPVLFPILQYPRR